MIESYVVAGPQHLASALVNGDLSGLDYSGLRDLAHYQRYLGPGAAVVSCEGESYFSRHWRIHGGRAPFTAGSLVDYIVHRTANT